MSDKKLENILSRMRKLEEETTKDTQERLFLKQKVKDLNHRVQELAKLIYS
jgi:wyosine [tRNA(Phe)-imidazoG37] synthetase (radical SAM superfamily)